MDTAQTELNQLGDTVVKLRRAKNWSLDELAAISGLQSEFIGDVEAGRMEATLLDIAALSKAFGITMKELLEMAEL